MKAILGLSAIAAAIGSACATSGCTTKTTTTITMTYPINSTGIMAGNGMTSVYNGTTSTLNVTGALTNPFSTALTVVDQTVLSYVTVPVGTCTISHECTLLISDNTVGASTTKASAAVVPNISTFSTDNGTLSLTTTTFRTTTTVVSQTQSAVLPEISSEISNAVDSSTIISLVTQYSTLLSVLTVTATPPSKTAESSDVISGSGSLTSSLPVVTVTVVPVASTTSLASTIPALRLTTVVGNSVVATIPAASSGAAGMVKPNMTSLLSISWLTAVFPTSNATTTESETTLPASSMALLPPATISVMDSSSPAHRLRVPRLISWLCVAFNMTAKPTQTTSTSASCPSNWVCLTETTWLSTTTVYATPSESRVLNVQIYHARRNLNQTLDSTIMTTTNGTNTTTITAALSLTVPATVTSTLTLTDEPLYKATKSSTITLYSTRENIYETAVVTVTATTKVSGAGASVDNWYLGLAGAFVIIAMTMIFFV